MQLLWVVLDIESIMGHWKLFTSVNAIEFQGDMFGLYEMQEERLHKNHSVYKLKHTAEVEYTQLLYS